MFRIRKQVEFNEWEKGENIEIKKDWVIMLHRRGRVRSSFSLIANVSHGLYLKSMIYVKRIL